MTVLSLPSGLIPSGQRWQEEREDVEFRSVFGSQILQPVAARWATELDFDDGAESGSGAFKALVLALSGGNQVEVYDFARPAPLGTLRGTLTLAAEAEQGATTLSISSGIDGLGKTLLAGDWLGIGTGSTQQVVMVVEDVAIPEYSLSLDFVNQEYYLETPGDFDVVIEPPLRNTFSAAESVVWDKPKALFRMRNNRPGWTHERSFARGLKLDLIESPEP